MFSVSNLMPKPKLMIQWGHPLTGAHHAPECQAKSNSSTLTNGLKVVDLKSCSNVGYDMRGAVQPMVSHIPSVIKVGHTVIGKSLALCMSCFIE